MNDENRRGAFRRPIEVLAFVAACLLLALPLIIAIQLAIPKNRDVSNKTKCSINLRSIYAAMALYANDYRFFPHMSAALVEDQPKDVSKAFRALVYFKYLNDTDALWCPSSEEFPTKFKEQPALDPRSFRWDDGVKPKPETPPIFTEQSDPRSDLNENLSYTKRRRQLSTREATSRELLSSDKAIRIPDIGSYRLDPDHEPTPIGCHDDGITLLLADGHVGFIPLTVPDGIEKIIRDLQVGCAAGEMREAVLEDKAKVRQKSSFEELVEKSQFWK